MKGGEVEVETSVLTQFAGPAIALIPIIVAIVAALKNSTEYVTSKNAAIVSTVVGILLSLGSNALGNYDPALSHGAAAVAGACAGLMGSGAYAAVKNIGLKKDDAVEEERKR